MIAWSWPSHGSRQMNWKVGKLRGEGIRRDTEVPWGRVGVNQTLINGRSVCYYFPRIEPIAYDIAVEVHKIIVKGTNQ